MGTTSSHHHHLDHGPVMDPVYPDMNVIFKGIPKMMQVADDMHVLAQAVTDLRNLTYVLSAITMLGMFMFIFLRCYQTRGKLRKRRRRLLTDSEHSSLSRRPYPQKPLEWNPHHKIDMEKLLEHSSSHGGSQQYTPPTMTPKRVPDYHSVERTPPPHVQTSTSTSTTVPTMSNGTAIKQLEPVKLLIDEVPYVDGSSMP